MSTRNVLAVLISGVAGGVAGSSLYVGNWTLGFVALVAWALATGLLLWLVTP